MTGKQSQGRQLEQPLLAINPTNDLQSLLDMNRDSCRIMEVNGRRVLL